MKIGHLNFHHFLAPKSVKYSMCCKLIPMLSIHQQMCNICIFAIISSYLYVVLCIIEIYNFYSTMKISSIFEPNNDENEDVQF